VKLSSLIGPYVYPAGARKFLQETVGVPIGASQVTGMATVCRSYEDLPASGAAVGLRRDLVGTRSPQCPDCARLRIVAFEEPSLGREFAGFR